MRTGCRAGSPPQVRGKHRPENLHRICPGITPAGAGKTIYFILFDFQAQDHPRRCGENGREAGATGVMSGSPPQVRGKPLTGGCLPNLKRITPAGAGKTRFRPPTEARDRDHPRRCGENQVNFASFREAKGSPPQVRGKPLFSALGGNNSRITPAGAGKTVLEGRCLREAKDHPRRCGENACIRYCRSRD